MILKFLRQYKVVAVCQKKKSGVCCRLPLVIINTNTIDFRDMFMSAPAFTCSIFNSGALWLIAELNFFCIQGLNKYYCNYFCKTFKETNT